MPAPRAYSTAMAAAATAATAAAAAEAAAAVAVLCFPYSRQIAVSCIGRTHPQVYRQAITSAGEAACLIDYYYY